MTEEWFIAINGAPIGPLTEEELLALHTRGDVEDVSLVWRQGMAGWIPFEDQFGADAVADPGAVAALEPSPEPAPRERGTTAPQPVRDADVDFSAARGSLPAAMQSAKILVAKPSGQAQAHAPEPVKPEGESAWAPDTSPRFQTALVKNVAGITSRTSAREAVGEAPTPTAPAEAGPAEIRGGDEAEPAPMPRAPTHRGELRAPGEDTMGMPEVDDGPIQPKAVEKAPVVEAVTREHGVPRLFSLRHFPGIERLNPGLLRSGTFNAVTPDLRLQEQIIGEQQRKVCDECGKAYQASHVDTIGGRKICKLCQQSVREKVKRDYENKENFRWLGGPLERAIYSAVFLGVVIGGIMLAMRILNIQVITETATTEIGYEEILPPTRWSTLPVEQWPQIALANHATFAETTALNRGSGFIVRAKGGRIIGVSSMVLLRTDHGVYPPVNPVMINQTMNTWDMYLPNNRDNLVRLRQVLTDPRAYVGTPVVYLEGKASAFALPAEPLKLQKKLPGERDKVNIVIADPNVTNGPSQRVLRGNIYPETSTPGTSVQIILTEKVNSAMPLVGAPVLNESGHVIAVCIGLKPFDDLWSAPGADGTVSPVRMQQFYSGYQAAVPPESDVVYAADIRGFPRSWGK